MRLVPRLAVCACAVGAAATAARASIVYRDIPDIHLVRSGYAGSLSADLDLDADGTNDLRFSYQWEFNIKGYGTSVQRVMALSAVAFVNRWPPDGFYGADRLQSGFSVEAVLAPPPEGSRYWGDGLLNYLENLYYRGFWSAQGYLGFRFAQSDGDHYGWIDMTARLGELSVFRLAYESTPDAPIAAGAVPAPGGAALLVGGLAGAGLRRRR